ncbi:TetR/AcrR family transcriptional regulator [Saccharopolyspora cebuensis]|uniref:TetR/AcrR family transcriptional regulator n=1 Tax=Saccharopolyspora cebuensis TaxID=418759 RepID=A0ABV4CAF1_9PSEU
MARPASPDAPGGAASAMGRRERKKRATRAAVGEAALRLSVRHGVEHVTVEQIAAEADIAPRTFFNHFSSKEEAVLAAAAAGAEALIAEFRVRPRTESVLRALREAVLVVLDRDDAASRDYVEALRLIRGEPSLLPHQLAVITAQEQALADAIADRIGPDAERDRPAYPALCAASALASLRVILDRWLGRGGEPGALDALRPEIDRAIGELAAGLDRPGR